jgi:hypothetical protein
MQTITLVFAAAGNGLMTVPMTDAGGRLLNLICGAGVNPDGSMARRMAIDGWEYGQICKDWPGVDATTRDNDINYYVSGACNGLFAGG